MKKSLSLTIALYGTALSYPVFSGSNSDLNVAGSLAPAPCTVVIAGGHRYNFGTIYADDLSSNQQNHYLQSKVVSIVCPAPTGLWVAFPFENSGQLKPHGSSGKNTGQLRWWTPSQNAVPTEECAYGLAEDERIRVDEGDGSLKDNTHYIRIYQSRVVVQNCPASYVYDGDTGNHNGAEDGYYIAHPGVKMLHVPRHLRMTLNPRDLLDTSGVIQIEGRATVVVNYM